MIDRLLKIIELKNINKSQFYREVGLSNGFLDKVRDVGASKLEQILNTYPDISPEWLLTGKGEMLRGSSGLDKEGGAALSDCRERLAIMEQLNDALRFKIDRLEGDIAGLKKPIKVGDGAGGA